MQPEQSPPAPPQSPQTVGLEQNPYSFFLDPPKPSKTPLLKAPGTTSQRLLFAGLGLVILIVVVTTLAKVITGGGQTKITALTSLATTQNELIRVAASGTQNAQSLATKNLAVTAEASLTSDQQQLLSLLQKNKVKLKQKQLLLAKSAATDAQLASAQTAGTFDQTFTRLLQTQLTAYAATVKKTFLASRSKTVRQLLNNDYGAAQLLLKQSQTPTS